MKYKINEINKIPNNPGIYKYYDVNDELIYVGKAKNLRKRIKSYFIDSDNRSIKINDLIKHIQYIDIILVNNEHESFLLENNFIKTYKPKYNTLLKDDRRYPYIAFTNEEYPRLVLTENINDYKLYFGPYSDKKLAKEILESIISILKIRSCKKLLKSQQIGKYKICLEYHLSRCKGICEGFISNEEYNKDILNAKTILNGNIKLVKQDIISKMNNSSKNENFLLAQYYKEILQKLNKYQSKSIISDVKRNNIDVFTYIKEDDKIFVCYMIIQSGFLIFVKTHTFSSQQYDIQQLLIAHQQTYSSRSKKVITNIIFDYFNLDIEIFVPQRGDNKKLLDLALFNLNEYIKQKTSELKNINNINQTLINLKNYLKLRKIPDHIECFDNSNLQGEHAVAAMVVYKKGQPCKNEYRHFIIKTVQGIDDYSSMREILYRRYCNKENLPDLVIVDGGKGQLHAAMDVFSLLNIDIDVVGLAKRLEEIFTTWKNDSIMLPKDSQELYLLQRIRDDTHNFGINFHRKRRQNDLINSVLSDIKGITDEDITILLTNLKTVNNIKNSSIDVLKQFIGEKKAKLVIKYFENHFLS